jgi:hypothetical protein
LISKNELLNFSFAGENLNNVYGFFSRSNIDFNILFQAGKFLENAWGN